jgi:hypothetical protein
LQSLSFYDLLSVAVCFGLIRLFLDAPKFSEDAHTTDRADSMADGWKPFIQRSADLLSETAEAPGADDFQFH